MCCVIFLLWKLPVYWKERVLEHDLQMEGSKQCEQDNEGDCL